MTSHIRLTPEEQHLLGAISTRLNRSRAHAGLEPLHRSKIAHSLLCAALKAQLAILTAQTDTEPEKME